MRPWIIEQKEKLNDAEAKRKALYSKLERTLDVDEYKRLCSEIAALDIKIDAMRARLKGKWAGSFQETFNIITQ